MTLKENEIIDICMRITSLIPEEEMEKPVICLDDYKHEFDISWTTDGKSFGGENFTLNEGACPSFGFDIEGYIKEEILNIFDELDEYEVFEVDKDDFEYQSAKIRVKSVKNI